jgi:hypothetical protein
VQWRAADHLTAVISGVSDHDNFERHGNLIFRFNY